MKVDILRQISVLDRSLQQLKVDFILGEKRRPKSQGLYDEGEILGEVRKVRKQLWNERYAKKAKSVS